MKGVGKSYLVLLALLGACMMDCENREAGNSREYLHYVEDRVREALDKQGSAVIAERVDGAYVLRLYLEVLLEEGAPAEQVRDAANKVKEWFPTEPEFWVRYYLYRSLGELKQEEDREFLLGFLEDQAPSFRALAAEYAGDSLEELMANPLSEEVERRLITAYRREHKWWVKLPLLESLARGTGDTSLEILHQSMEDTKRHVRALASRALAYRKDVRSVAPLMLAVETAGLVGKDTPVGTLATIASPESRRLLEQASRSPWPMIRANAARGLGHIGDRRSLPILASLIDDEDWMVGNAAASALIRLGGSDAARHVVAFLARDFQEDIFAKLLDMEDDVVLQACKTLLEEGGPDEASRQRLRELCGTLRERIGESSYWVWSSATGHAWHFSPFNADARRVAPVEGDQATGWELAVGEKSGGERHSLERGTQVTVWRAVEYEGETWLEVHEGPYGFDGWVREADLEEISPEELAGKEIWHDYGATTTMRIRRDSSKEDTGK